jgi:Flp pilus assembly protein TadD
MNFDYCFMKWVPGALIFIMLLTSACTVARQTPAEPAAAVPAAAAETSAATEAAKPLPQTDEDVMLHVFTAETLGAAGDFAGAAAEYLKAALISRDPEIAERAARVAVSANEWQLVALASDRWAMLDPAILEARELAAGSRLKEVDYVGAEYQMARILEMTGVDEATGWRTVTSLLAPVNDRVRAAKVLDHLVKDFAAESNVEALFARSQLAAILGDLDEATRLVDRAIVAEPARADLLAWAGRLAVNTGNESLALKRYRQSWQAGPDNPQVAMSYAELLKRNNDLKTAQNVLAQLPDKPEMRFARLVFALDADDRETAEQLYAGFSEVRYEDASEAAFQAAQSAELLEKPREAIRWYAKVSGDRSLRAVMRRAFLMADLGETDAALGLLEDERTGADAAVVSQCYLVEAQILQQAEREEEAMQLLAEALSSLPDDTALRYSRALLAVNLGRLELAENDLRLIIAKQPDNAAALNALGYTLADLTDRLEEAEELIRRAYELEPDDPSIIDSMGWVSYRLGRLPEAEAYMREAWSAMRNAEVAAHLGEVLWARGQQDEAREMWKLGMELEPDNKVLISTMKRFGVLP